jgi:hypothetical protein
VRAPVSRPDRFCTLNQQNPLKLPVCRQAAIEALTRQNARGNHPPWQAGRTWQMWHGTYAPRNESHGATPATASPGCHTAATHEAGQQSDGLYFGWRQALGRFNVVVFELGHSMNRVASNRTPLQGSLNERAPRGAEHPLYRRAAWALATVVTWLAVAGGSAVAQPKEGATQQADASGSSGGQLPNVVLFSTAGPRATMGSLDSVISASLGKLDVVKVAARPGMDLSAVQLAIDCVGETPPCLRAVAKQTQAQILIAPSLQTAQSELVLTILRFDVDTGQSRRALHRQPGTTVTSETLDRVPGMLRELFDVPEPKPQPSPSASESKTTEQQPSELETVPPYIEPPQEPAARPVPIGPILLGGAGVLVVGGGLIAGAVKSSTQDKYNSLRLTSMSDVDELIDLGDQAKTQATIANVMFAVGGAMAVAGGIWLAVALSQPAPREDWQTAVVPAVAPGQLGLAIVHRGGAL